MVRLYFFGEGDTETTFARTVLQPHLAPLDIFIHPIGIAIRSKPAR